MVVPAGRQIHHHQVECLDTRHSYMGDLFQLVERAREREYDRFLVINADSVLVTAKSLQSFLELTEGSEAGIIWPAIRRHSIPEMLRQTVLNDLPGRPDLIRSGVMMFRPASLHPKKNILRKLARDPNKIVLRSPLGLPFWAFRRVQAEFYRRYAELPLLGLRNCIMWGMKLLNTEEIKSCMKSCLGCERVEMPELDIGVFGFDVDTPKELKLAEDYLRRWGR